MKVAVLLFALLLTGCASKCPDCLTITRSQLGEAMHKAWSKGWDQGFEDGEDSADSKRLKAL